ncbi:MAG: M20/M25/M40 family metallo-hydrolase [Flavobacteriaceae bacterium]|nr:M20/M25/M40 family metallo-hydrolase [Flavobacteriaceae bacterium]
MKKITYLFCLFLVIQNYAQETQFSSELIEEHLFYLASDELMGRDTGSEGIEMAAQYLEKHFKKHQVKPFYKTYRDSFMVKNKHAYNIVAVVEGTDENLKEELVMVGAHYDHIGITDNKVEGDSIVNGANDNAVSVVAVMKLAQHFAENPPQRSVLFTLYSAEELGLLGSKHLAQRMKDEKQNLHSVFNIEMIGVPMENVDYMAYLTGINQSNYATVFNEAAEEKVLGFFEPSEEMQLFKRSDNYPFYQEFGVAAHTVCTFDFQNYEYYHHPKDEAEFMDIEHMNQLITNFALGIEGIANSKKNEVKMNNN